MSGPTSPAHRSANTALITYGNPAGRQTTYTGTAHRGARPSHPSATDLHEVDGRVLPTWVVAVAGEAIWQCESTRPASGRGTPTVEGLGGRTLAHGAVQGTQTLRTASTEAGPNAILGL